jgi:hypothetical protein
LDIKELERLYARWESVIEGSHRAINDIADAIKVIATGEDPGNLGMRLNYLADVMRPDNGFKPDRVESVMDQIRDET